MRRFLWLSFLILNILLMGVFVGGYSAIWIDPRAIWWIQLFAIIFPITTLGLCATGLVSLLFKKWWLAGTHLLLLLLAFMRFFSFGASTDTSVYAPSSLRITSYNLGELESKTQEEMASTLMDVVRHMQPDVFCMQEFLIRYRGNPLRFRNLPRVAAVFDSLGYQVVASDVHAVSNSFKPVLTHRDKVKMVTKERLSLVEEGVPETSVIRTVIEFEGRKAAIYNVHLHTYGERKPWTEKVLNPLNPGYWSFFAEQYKEAFIYRAWQADKIHDLINQEELPLLLIGDFNSTPHNWVFNRISSGLQDAYEETGVKRKASYHSRFPVVKIDHVLVSEEWEVLGADVLPYAHSDHMPLLVLLRWKQ